MCCGEHGGDKELESVCESLQGVPRKSMKPLLKRFLKIRKIFISWGWLLVSVWLALK